MEHDVTYYWPTFSRLNEEGTLVMRVTSYKGWVHWTGAQEVRPDNPDYRFWLWIATHRECLAIFFPDEALPELRAVFEGRSTTPLEQTQASKARWEEEKAARRALPHNPIQYSTKNLQPVVREHALFCMTDEQLHSIVQEAVDNGDILEEANEYVVKGRILELIQKGVLRSSKHVATFEARELAKRTKYIQPIRDYCARKGITVPIGFSRQNPNRYAVIRTDKVPPKLVATTWLRQEEVVYYIERILAPEVGSETASKTLILDFETGSKLRYAGQTILEPDGAID